MPYLPREFEQRRKGRTPDIVGEEGALIHDGPYWIKRWTSSHEQGFGIPHREREVSVAPPHWAKFQFWQNKVIHDLLPDLAIDIVAGYDPRIHKEADGTHSFAVERGKPATISRDIPVQGEMPTQYMNTVHGLYHRTAPKFDQIRNTHGDDVSPELRAEYDTDWEETEDKLVQMIKAEEFRWFQGDQGDLTGPGVTERFFRTLEDKVRAVNPRSPILQLLRIGVVPVHPSFNFIPRESTQSSNRPDGTFVEMRIMNFNRTRLSIQNLAPHDREKAQRSFERFCLYNDICGMYNQLMITLLQTENGETMDDTTHTLLYQLLERVLEYGRAGNLQYYNQVMNAVTPYICNLIATAPNISFLNESLRSCVQGQWSFGKSR